ncbi:MAG TPA: UDP-N-acetylmuramate:L-alanyl-gamma-D-glutamyl-meso-diaminopimelate ligase [Candidatus Limnocylindria bacterium]|jgi:UDP-N-acetylmuramate: L-alanyl-gamma-D-glutamyl-meso-diaminopimelate ligase|nr:UDP-N-acetylmuramate:L-alanyl-gamma-D-glutamyl-meso-diaminopimelate ligase [Candidatus Limnocylindria bacterium]
MIGSIKSVHFIGICGTAMASAAAAMKERGYDVTGSDQNVYPPMSTFLQERGIPVMAGYAEHNLAHKPDLVIVGNAISRGNPEAEAVLERKLRYASLPELLKEFFIRGKRSLVVTGTHGKTTTTSLLAWVFESAGLNPSYMIGGIPRNLGQGARFTDSEWFIIEGDEYDTAFFDKRSKFIHYLPEVAIINNLEFDHADIFPTLGDIQLSFKRMINLIPRNGLLLANGDELNLAPLLGVNHCPVKRFGLGERNEIRASGIFLRPESSEFQLGDTRFSLPLIGELNVRNALAVVACARHCGLTDAAIQKAFSTFESVKRRMEVRGEAKGVTVVDDFGHHPTAIRETVRALRVRFPGRRVWAVFEPRSNTTRRNVFQTELVEALERADLIVVSEVARIEQLKPEERLNPEKLMQDLRLTGKPAAYLPTVDAILDHVMLSVKEGDVICVFSNGGFGDIHNRLLGRLRG